ncbi:tetratricopeptide repeat protein [Spirochaetota bacterium]
MPNLQEIERFKNSIKSLGKEAEVLARWGESWQDTKAPESGVPDDLASLLDLDDASALEDGTTFDTELSGGENDAAGQAMDDSFGDSTSGQVPDGQPEDDFSDFLESMQMDDQTPEAEPAEAEAIDDGFEMPASFQDESGDFSIPDELEEQPLSESFFGSAGGSAGDILAEAEADADGIGTVDGGLGDLSGDTADAIPDLSEDDFSVPSGLTEGLFADGGAAEDSAASELDSFSFDEPGSDLDAPDASDQADELSFSFEPESSKDDAFDHFSMDEQLPSKPAAESAALGSLGDGLDEQLMSLDSELSGMDTFSLEDSWDGSFSIPGFEMGTESSAASLAAPSSKPSAKAAKKTTGLADAFAGEAAMPREEKQARKVELSESQVDALQDTLLSYPLNLRLAVEDIIANERGSLAQQADLVWLMVEGALAKDTAKLASRILKRYIEVPSGFAKRSGAIFVADKSSFRYIFVHSVLPILQTLALVAAATAFVFFLGYRFVYRPVKANSLYSEGRRQIYTSNYAESMSYFDKAVKLWQMKHWYYRYAEAFRKENQRARAEEIYKRLLGYWPKEKRAALDYAGMESEYYDYAKTERILQEHILDRLYFDREALTLMAKNYLDWADSEEQAYNPPEHEKIRNIYEKARLQIATLMERHGRTDSNMEMMLLYLMRTDRFFDTDKRKDVMPFVDYALDNKKLKWRADTLAELGNYLLDKDELENVSKILLKAVDADGSLPEAHAAMARWNRLARFPKDELKALEYAARFYKETNEKTGLVSKRLKTWILSMMRLGELRLADGRSLDAEDAYRTAIENYERAVKSRIFRPEARFGRAYSLLADIYYMDRMDFAGALNFYERAEKDGYTSPETDYRRGYIHYNAQGNEFLQALRYFYRAGLDRDASPYLVLATANALFERGDYFASTGYYSTLVKRLQFELDTIELPSPQQRPSHKEMVELLMVAKNNLGASVYRVAERMGDGRRRAEAMLEFSESARYFDSMSRDFTSMVRSDSKNLGFLNNDFVLHPQRGIDISIYKVIPAEMDYPQGSGRN